MDFWEMKGLQVVYVGDDILFAVRSEEELRRHGCTQPILRFRRVDEAIDSLTGLESNSPLILLLEEGSSVSAEVEFPIWLPHHVSNPNLAVFLLGSPKQALPGGAWECLPKTKEWVQNVEDFVTARNHKAFDARLPNPDGIMGQLALMSAFSVESIVLTDANGYIGWVNESFERMCGYSFKELYGKKPGSVLQGPDTDPAGVSLLRESVRDLRPCECVIVNYTKDKKPYTVHVSLGPVVEEDLVKGFLALETLLAPTIGP